MIEKHNEARLEALARAMFPAIFGRPAPGPVRRTATKVICLTAYRLQRPMLAASTLTPPFVPTSDLSPHGLIEPATRRRQSILAVKVREPRTA
jgi:hypothetical protein